ncbi:MAG: carbon-nitrogen hydrolase family protein [Chloroflexota bacterium]
MARKIKVAAVQMDAQPAPTIDRLNRAERVVEQAVQAGAQLVVLPEIFNTGYGYTDENFKRAEPIDGQTATWLKETAVKHQIHLAGSLMLLENGEIYNSLLLFGPDGTRWRYDKNYPWGWERGYFRGRKGVTVAKTELGDIGILICWDVAHRNLWRQYAGEVDLMLLSSCPPDVANPTFAFPNGDKVTFDDFGRVGASLKGSARRLFGDMVNQQTAWLGVPTVQAVGSGQIKTDIPSSMLSLISYIPVAPILLKYMSQANDAKLECGFVQGSKIANSQGEIQVELEQDQGETFTIGEVTLANNKKVPDAPQPKTVMPAIAYFSSDYLLPLLMRSVYAKGKKQIHGVSKSSKPEAGKLVALSAAVLFGFGLWAFFRRKR